VDRRGRQHFPEEQRQEDRRGHAGLQEDGGRHHKAGRQLRQSGSATVEASWETAVTIMQTAEEKVEAPRTLEALEALEAKSALEAKPALEAKAATAKAVPIQDSLLAFPQV